MRPTSSSSASQIASPYMSTAQRYCSLIPRFWLASVRYFLPALTSVESHNGELCSPLHDSLGSVLQTELQLFRDEGICSDSELSKAMIQAYNAMRESFPVREEAEKHTELYVAYGEGASEVSTMKWERLSIATKMSPTN